MAYFDNAATTFPKPEEVYQFTDKFYRECGVNVGRGQHKQAYEASKLVAETRELIAEMFHSPSKKVIFSHSATESINTILHGIKFSDGDNIYISPFEHNAVTRVINQLQSVYNINVIKLAVNKDTLEYELEKISSMFEYNKPKMLVISHASNVCGIIAPIHELCGISKKFDAINVIDMAQTAGLIDTNLNSDIFDFAIFAGHKTLYSPLGIAGFVCKNNTALKPLIYGGTGVDSANQEMPSSIPERYEAGSPNIMAIAGLNASLKWIRMNNINNVYKKEKMNHQKLLETLKRFDNIKIIGSLNIERTVGVVSCVFEGYSSDDIGQVLSNHDIAARTGLHCAPSAHQFLGTFPAGTVRFSVSYFNDEKDFDDLSEILNYIYDNR